MISVGMQISWQRCAAEMLVWQNSLVYNLNVIKDGKHYGAPRYLVTNRDHFGLSFTSESSGNE